jgi:glutamyl-Q tRNA(Asp) synthetase
LRTLDVFGFEWDGPVLIQSHPERQQAYEGALERLAAQQLIYPCACSRKQIAEAQADAEDEPIYPGICRNGLTAQSRPRAWRLRVNEEVVSFLDGAHGPIEQCLAPAVGDFVLKRADGPFAYQLAVVVDDAAQGVTDVVRGADLLTSAPRQIYLQRLLGLPQPRYLHVPLVLTEQGIKMSKQTGAPGLDLSSPALELWRALQFLRMDPPPELRAASVAELWKWAATAWSDYTVQSFTASASEVIGSRVGINSWAK